MPLEAATKPQKKNTVTIAANAPELVDDFIQKFFTPQTSVNKFSRGAIKQ